MKVSMLKSNKYLDIQIPPKRNSQGKENKKLKLENLIENKCKGIGIPNTTRQCTNKLHALPLQSAKNGIDHNIPRTTQNRQHNIGNSGASPFFPHKMEKLTPKLLPNANDTDISFSGFTSESEPKEDLSQYNLNICQATNEMPKNERYLVSHIQNNKILDQY